MLLLLRLLDGGQEWQRERGISCNPQGRVFVAGLEAIGFCLFGTAWDRYRCPVSLEQWHGKSRLALMQMYTLSAQSYLATRFMKVPNRGAGTVEPRGGEDPLGQPLGFVLMRICWENRAESPHVAFLVTTVPHSSLASTSRFASTVLPCGWGLRSSRGFGV